MIGRAFEAEVIGALRTHWLPPAAHADGLSPEEMTEAEGQQFSLMRFVEDAWGIVEPDHPFVPNWHLDAICQHLEAVTAGTIPRLLLNVPSGTMKSLLVSVFFPAWEWISHPELRYLCASYGQELATRDNQRCRDLVQSAWYQARWPHVRLREGANQKTRYDTTAGGWRIGTSVGGRGTGEHPDRIIIDDPHSARQAESAAARDGAVEWFDQTISPRGVSRDARQIVIMQRLHQNDLSGHLIEQMARRPWCHICLPMRAEPNRMPPTALGWTDPRDFGVLLWPALYPEAKVRALEIALGQYGAAGQMQQRPAPEGGGLFRREWFKFVTVLPKIARRTRGWDTAGTEGGGDYTAGVKIGEGMEANEHGTFLPSGQFFIEHVIRGQLGPAAVEATMRQTAELDGRFGCAQREEKEGGASGTAVIAARTKLLKGFDYKGVVISRDKVTRSRPFRAQCEAGNVLILRTEDPAVDAWIEPYLAELCGFPTGSHDDQVDASSCAFNSVVLEPSRTVRVREAVWG